MTLGLMDPALIGSLTGYRYTIDAQDYIARVEAADGLQLETEVKSAIIRFVDGCNADDLSIKLKTGCILAGPRTLAGALTPLVGVSPTNFNFVATDYDRRIGLLGNGSTKYLDSNRSNSTDPRNNKHVSAFVSSLSSVATRPSIGLRRRNDEGPGTTLVYGTFTRLHDNTSSTYTASAGFIGLSRSSATNYIRRNGGSNTDLALASVSQHPGNILLFADNLLNAPTYSGARIAFYSIGESLDLTLLDTRVTRLINEIQFFLNTGLDGSTYDIDTLRYINAGYAAGGTFATSEVATFVNIYETFITDCKADGIWASIKAGCIMAGWNGLGGALTPLAGTAPTNFNFVAADYDRKTGLIGNGSSKYLNANRNNNADPQNSRHISVYLSSVTIAGSFQDYISSATVSISGASYISRSGTTPANTGINLNGELQITRASGASTGFAGLSRSSSSEISSRFSESTVIHSQPSVTPINQNYNLFRRNNSTGYAAARIAFYSIGESLDLTLLDTRVTRLINEIQFFLNTGLDGSAYDIDTLRYINAGYAAGGTLL